MARCFGGQIVTLPDCYICHIATFSRLPECHICQTTILPDCQTTRLPDCHICQIATFSTFATFARLQDLPYFQIVRLPYCQDQHLENLKLSVNSLLASHQTSHRQTNIGRERENSNFQSSLHSVLGGEKF